MRYRDIGLLLVDPELGADNDAILGGSTDPLADPGTSPTVDEPQMGPAPDPEPDLDTDPDVSAPDVGEPAGGAAPESPPAAPVEDYQTISAARILEDRPDVLKAFYESYYRNNDAHSTAWSTRVGGDTPEAYASYWYKNYGKYEGYAQSPTTAGDNISLARILQERPDVLRAYYEGYYRGDPHSTAWRDRVGGDSAEDYAKYWYNKYGKYEGYAQSDKAASENISVDRLLLDRPDVFRAFYTEFYGAHNDRHSKAWVERVGGDTVEDYAKYWYESYGKHEGYSQAPRPVAAAPPGPEPAETPQDSAPPQIPPPVEDPSIDPWNHPAIYGDNYPRPPELEVPAPEPEVDPVETDGDLPAEAMVDVGRSLMDADPFG